MRFMKFEGQLITVLGDMILQFCPSNFHFYCQTICHVLNMPCQQVRNSSDWYDESDGMLAIATNVVSVGA